MPKYWTREAWLKSGTPEQRRKTATLNPLAWILEYEPKIRFPGRGLIPFEPYPFQQDFVRCRDRYRAINKPRQCGISTAVAAEVAWEFDNVPAADIIILSKDKKSAQQFMDYAVLALVTAHENNPDAPKIVKQTQTELVNDKGARITAFAATKENGRSFSATHLIFDEMAFAPFAQEIWQASSPTLARTGGRATVISTPKGRSNMFAEIFETRGNLGFKTFSYGWWDVPDYNPFYDELMLATDKNERKKIIDRARTSSWYIENRASKTELAWKQEFEGEFDANMGTAFSTRQIEKCFVKNYLREQHDESGIFTQWWTSDKDEKGIYVVGIDLGRKNDPTVIVTYDVSAYPSGRAEVVDFKYIEAGRCDWSMIDAAVKKHVDLWDATAIHDGTGVGDSVTDSLTGYSEPFMFTKNAKQNIIELMQHAFDWRKVRIPKIPILYDEHRKYIWDDKDITQDTVMANGLAIYGFYDSEEVFSGFADLNFVGAIS